LVSAGFNVGETLIVVVTLSVGVTLIVGVIVSETLVVGEILVAVMESVSVRVVEGV